ncbi:MAG: hypothetical protein GKR98_03135 [Boseongicola sp.]|nr:MAG: hypothetical protein GKR98_03135 [Boseongicola sp.]
MILGTTSNPTDRQAVQRLSPLSILRRFRRKDDGAVTVEAVLWVPFFLLLMFAIAELSLIFHGQARALQVAQETNRAYSVGRFAATSDAEVWAEFAMSKFSPRTQAATTVSDYIVTTVITVPAGDFAGNLGIFGTIGDLTIRVEAQRVVEF